jgi:integrase/recombinase XerD
MVAPVEPPPDRLARLLAEHQDWLAVERGLAANSRAAYRRDLRRYASFLRERGVDDPAAVGEETVQDYVRYLGSITDDEGRAVLAPSSIARALVAVRSFHGFCAAEGFLPTDPSEEVDAPRVPQGIPKALDEEQVEALLGAVTGNGPLPQRDRALLETLYATGIRISEAVGLELGDLDLEDGLVRVLGKGDKERIVPMGRSARRVVGAYLADGRLALRSARRRGADSDAVFLNARGGRISRQACWSIVRSAGARVGLDAHLSPHVLRHSCATHMLDHGADLRVVQELLGHASISTTQVYTKVSPERLRAVYDAAHPRARARSRA